METIGAPSFSLVAGGSFFLFNMHVPVSSVVSRGRRGIAAGSVLHQHVQHRRQRPEISCAGSVLLPFGFALHIQGVFG